MGQPDGEFFEILNAAHTAYEESIDDPEDTLFLSMTSRECHLVGLALLYLKVACPETEEDANTYLQKVMDALVVQKGLNPEELSG